MEGNFGNVCRWSGWTDVVPSERGLEVWLSVGQPRSLPTSGICRIHLWSIITPRGSRSHQPFTRWGGGRTLESENLLYRQAHTHRNIRDTITSAYCEVACHYGVKNIKGFLGNPYICNFITLVTWDPIGTPVQVTDQSAPILNAQILRRTQSYPQIATNSVVPLGVCQNIKKNRSDEDILSVFVICGRNVLHATSCMKFLWLQASMRTSVLQQNIKFVEQSCPLTQM